MLFRRIIKTKGKYFRLRPKLERTNRKDLDEQRLKKSLFEFFDKYDTNQDGFLELTDVEEFLKQMGKRKN